MTWCARRASAALVVLACLAGGARVAAQDAGTDGPVRVAGSAAPWVPGAAFRQLPSAAALRELYAGRADAVLVSLPGGAAPRGVSPVAWVPVAVFPVLIAYHLPGAELRLDLRLACRIFAGRVRVWNDAEIARLNPEARLPALPILVSARHAANAGSLAFADACVRGGWWPRAWRKSNWVAGAAFARATLQEQTRDLRLMGAVGVFGARELPAGAQVARLRTLGGAFVPPAGTLGLAPGSVPTRPGQSLSLPQQTSAYPLRGLVWAGVLRQQQYRGRTVREAAATLAFVRALQASGSADFEPLPLGARREWRVVFGGQPLEKLLAPAVP